MPVTTTLVGQSGGKKIHRHVETGSANTQLVVTVPGGSGRRLLQVLTKYSAAPTQAGVTTEIDSGAGAAYDSTLNTGAANAQNTAYVPQEKPMVGNDDAIRVTAPAGGIGITASVSVYTIDA